MSNNLTPIIGGGGKRRGRGRGGRGNREEQQIQTVNINNRKNNNDSNTFNLSEINHILLACHIVFSLVVVPVILLCYYPYLCYSSLWLLSPAPLLFFIFCSFIIPYGIQVQHHILARLFCWYVLSLIFCERKSL